jgi:hypothetical protein
MSVCFDKDAIIKSIDLLLFLEVTKRPRHAKPESAFGRLKTELTGVFKDVPITRVYKNADFVGRLVKYLEPGMVGGLPGLGELTKMALATKSDLSVPGAIGEFPSGMTDMSNALGNITPDMSSALGNLKPDMSSVIDNRVSNTLPPDASNVLANIKNTGASGLLNKLPPDASNLLANIKNAGASGLLNKLPPGMSGALSQLTSGTANGIPGANAVFTMIGLNDPSYIGEVVNDAVCKHIMKLNTRIYRSFTDKLALECQTIILTKLLGADDKTEFISITLHKSDAIPGDNKCVEDAGIQTRIETIVKDELELIKGQLGLLVTEMFNQTKSKIQSFSNTNVQAIGDKLIDNETWKLPEPKPGFTDPESAAKPKEKEPQLQKKKTSLADSLPAYAKAVLFTAKIARGKMLQDQLVDSLRFKFEELVGTADVDQWVAKELLDRINSEPSTQIQDDILTIKVRKYYKNIQDGKTEETKKDAESVGGRKKTRRRRTQKRRRSTRRR